jgi:RES domain
LTDPQVPEPPAPATLDPLLKVWPSGADLWRVHKLDRRPAELNPGVDVGRFHPFSGSAGKPVATLYAASTWQGAVSETLFRDVPLRGAPRTKRRAEIELRAMSLLRLRREVQLVELRGTGLRRLRLQRRELIETEADQYPRSAGWAAALHQAAPKAAGLVWTSRLHDPAAAVVFFGDRVAERDFSPVEGPIPLGIGKGLARVMELAEEAGILITLS